MSTEPVPDVMSKTQYARHRRVQPSTITRAAQTGRIPVRDDGQIDVAAADEAWMANTSLTSPRNSINGTPHLPGQGRKRGRPRAARAAAGDGSERPGPGAEPEDDDAGDGAASGNGDGKPLTGVETLNAARLRTEQAKAAKAEIELARMRGKLVEAELVRKSAFHAARVSRDLLMGIPARLSSELAGMDDDTQVYARLEEEIRKVCEQIAEAVQAHDWMPPGDRQP